MDKDIKIYKDIEKNSMPTDTLYPIQILNHDERRRISKLICKKPKLVFRFKGFQLSFEVASPFSENSDLLVEFG